MGEEKRTSKGEKKENIDDASSKQTSNLKTEKIEQDHQNEIQVEASVEVVRIDNEKREFTTPDMITKIGPVNPQMEELVEVVRIDKKKCEITTPVQITRIGPVKPQMEESVEVVRIDKGKCEFTTPVQITKIGPVKPKMEELVEIKKIDNENCEFTTPVMITKIGKVGDWKKRDVVDKTNGDEKELANTKNDTELVEVVRIDKNESTEELEKTKNYNDLTLSEPYILATDESEGIKASGIHPSKRSENISEATVNEGISVKNHTIEEDEEKAKRASKKETAKVMENMNFLGIDKCACTDQVPVLVLDRLKKIEKENDEVEVKIFKVDLDLDDSVSDLDKAKKSLREKPLRLPLTSIRCGGFQPKMLKEENEGNKDEQEARMREEPELVENEDLGEKPVLVNATAVKPLELELETVQRVNDSTVSRRIPYKVKQAKVEGGGGEEPQRVMVTVPYKMPVRISKDEAGEVPVPLDCHQALELPYQLREVPQQVPRSSVALEGEMSTGAHRITS